MECLDPPPPPLCSMYFTNRLGRCLTRGPFATVPTVARGSGVLRSDVPAAGGERVVEKDRLRPEGEGQFPVALGRRGGASPKSPEAAAQGGSSADPGPGPVRVGGG